MQKKKPQPANLLERKSAKAGAAHLLSLPLWEGLREGFTPTPDRVVVWGWLVDRDFRESIVPVGDADRGTANLHTRGGEIDGAGKGTDMSGQCVHLVKPGLAFVIVPIGNDDCACGFVRFHPERKTREGSAA